MTDTKYPERLYFNPNGLCEVVMDNYLSEQCPGDIEYVRSDAVNAMIEKARNEALEEAAKVCEERREGGWSVHLDVYDAAKAIRSLKKG